MKHFGMNVASDAVFPSVYIGATGGLVYVCADDPGMNSSGTEPDSRHFAPHMKMPMLEPADSQECKDFTKRAFELSEQFDTPFMLRTTVRVNHGSSIVTLEDRVEVPVKHYERDIMKNTNIPALARNKHKTVEERLVRLQEFSNETDLNRVELHDTKIGVICAGICYQYAREVFGDGASYLKLGFTYPMPDRKIREFAAQVDKLYVLEELDPFIEDYVRGLGIECTGKAVLPLYLEYSADIIRRAPSRHRHRMSARSNSRTCRPAQAAPTPRSSRSRRQPARGAPPWPLRCNAAPSCRRGSFSGRKVLPVS